MKTLSNFWLPFALFALTSSVLLLSDSNNRSKAINETESRSDNNDFTSIALINLIESPALDPAIAGFKNRLNEQGFVEGENLVFYNYNAQGELSVLPQIIESAIQKNPAVIVSITSPALVAASSKIETIPYVYCVATDPKLLGLFPNGVPENITGVYATSTIPQLIDLATKQVTDLRSIGTIYDPSQSQSVIEVEILKSEGVKRGIEIHTTTVSSVTDISLAVQSLIQKGMDVCITSADNLVNVGFPSLQKATSAANIPILVSDLTLLEQGATAGIGPDYTVWGEQAADQVINILKGVSPSRIPMEPVKVIELTN